MSNQDNDAMDSTTLAPLERDTICEMTSIAMGAAGSTLSLLLGQEIEVPTPNMAEYATLPEMDVPFGDDPKMLLTVNYNQGIEATALLIIRDADARRLAGSMARVSHCECAVAGSDRCGTALRQRRAVDWIDSAERPASVV